LSGGASSLLVAPAAGLTLDDKQALAARLLASGADIADVNVVRKHCSRVKGGGLARQAARAGGLWTLVLSDVVGDDPATIASGPTVGDPSTFRDAAAVLARYLAPEDVPVAVRAHLERGAAGAARRGRGVRRRGDRRARAGARPRPRGGPRGDRQPSAPRRDRGSPPHRAHGHERRRSGGGAPRRVLRGPAHGRRCRQRLGTARLLPGRGPARGSPAALRAPRGLPAPLPLLRRAGEPGPGRRVPHPRS